MCGREASILSGAPCVESYQCGLADLFTGEYIYTCVERWTYDDDFAEPEDSESWVLVDYAVDGSTARWVDVVVATKYSLFKTYFPDGSSARFNGSLWTDMRGGRSWRPVWRQEPRGGETYYWVPGRGCGWHPVPEGLVVIPAEEIDGHIWDKRLDGMLISAICHVHCS